MMQRRGFLGALMGLAAAPVLARLLPAQAPQIQTAAKSLIELLEQPQAIILPTLECDGVGALLSLRAIAGGEFQWQQKNPSGFRLMRSDGETLLQNAVADGMVLMQNFGAGNEPVFTKGSPLVLDVPITMDFDLTYMVDGRVYWRKMVGGRVVADVPLQPGARRTIGMTLGPFINGKESGDASPL